MNTERSTASVMGEIEKDLGVPTKAREQALKWLRDAIAKCAVVIASNPTTTVAARWEGDDIECVVYSRRPRRQVSLTVLGVPRHRSPISVSALDENDRSYLWEVAYEYDPLDSYVVAEAVAWCVGDRDTLPGVSA